MSLCFPCPRHVIGSPAPQNHRVPVCVDVNLATHNVDSKLENTARVVRDSFWIGVWPGTTDAAD